MYIYSMWCAVAKVWAPLCQRLFVFQNQNQNQLYWPSMWKHKEFDSVFYLAHNVYITIIQLERTRTTKNNKLKKGMKINEWSVQRSAYIFQYIRVTLFTVRIMQFIYLKAVYWAYWAWYDIMRHIKCKVNDWFWSQGVPDTGWLVKCSSVWRPGGRNCFYVWMFWCTVFCNACQRGEVQTDCVPGVMGLQRCYLPFSWILMYISPGWRAA